jgi:hypothetical protein
MKYPHSIPLWRKNGELLPGSWGNGAVPRRHRSTLCQRSRERPEKGIRSVD